MKRRLKGEKLLAELEEVAEKLFSDIRRDQGTFQTGTCTLRGEKVLLINNRQSVDERISAIAREIAHLGTENLYLKPAIREVIEQTSTKEEIPD